MHALILAPFEQGCLQKLQARMDVTYESWMESRRLYAPEELTAKINDAGIEALIVEADFVLEETFAEAPGLRFVGICRNATDHIDVDSATEQGVVVVNSPGRNAVAVAELVVGLMFAMARRIPASHRYVATGCWEDPVSPYLELRGTEVGGKTLGILGLGTIGTEVAKMARGLGMGVTAYDPFIEVKRAASLGVSLVDIDAILKTSDFISIHLPTGPETSAIIDQRAFRLMKPTAFLINTSTAQAIDYDALQIALEKNEIRGAALDVHDTSPIAPDHPLLGLDSIILTPHIGGATDGTVARHSRMMTEDLECFLDGKQPPRIVNPSVWRPGD